MYRKIENKINKWLSDSDKAFLLTGARQIGKTWIIREVLKKSKYNFFEINFIQSPELVTALGTDVPQEEFLMRLSAMLPATYEPGSTVVFFDEVQQNPEITTRIKFLVDEGSYRYIMSGSLLGVQLKSIMSAPVGYLTTEQMYPMDFEEFMIAQDISSKVFEHLKSSYTKRQPVDEFIHKKLLSLFYVYLIVGGMPDAVNCFCKTKDLRQVSQIHRDIIKLYKADFTKYEKEDKKLKLISIYDIIPSELNKQNKRFVFTYLNKELKFSRYENSFLWLKDAGVALPVYNVETPRVPLVTGKSSNVFRLFSSDVGLLTTSYPDDVKLQVLLHNGEINNGALFENAVAQQLTANGFTPYFYKKAKIGEVDFLVEKDGSVLPIEVKSGKNAHSHKSLDNLLQNQSGYINQAVVVTNENISVEKNFFYVPVYMTYLIQEFTLPDTKISLDLTGLLK